MFKEVSFTGCKMIGVRMEDCNDFLLSFSMENCNLSYASFREMSLRKMHFTECVFEAADMTAADFSRSIFDKCILEKVHFEQTILDGADLSTSTHLRLDPDRNSIRKAIFSNKQLVGLLEKHDIVIR
jgi:uncharacterized protein YjbI with pentapeptide repeats